MKLAFGRAQSKAPAPEQTPAPPALAVPAGSRFTQIVLGLVALGIAVAYGGGFGIGFYFDDGYGIRDNPAIRSLANIPSFFADPFTLTTVRENVDLRPVLVTTYALNYAISGNDPWSYHLLNMLLHFGAAWMVYLLVRDHLWWPEAVRGADGSARLPAAAAALLFALAPIQTQAINYMWARSALLCTVLYLAAFLALLRGRLLGALLLHSLALLTKAIAMTMPVAFVAYDFLYRNRERHPDFRAWIADWRELVPPVAPFLALDLAYLVLRWSMLPEWADEAMKERWVTPWIWFMSQWSALLHYVRIFVWPTGLSVDHDFAYTMHFAEFAAWGSLVAIACWVVAALWNSQRYPQVAFATVWFFLTLAPESTFFPLAEVVNDHRPYIANSLGLSLLAAWLLYFASSYAGRRRREVFVAAVVVLSIGATSLAARRTAEWTSEDRLWESTVRASPNNGRAWMNAGLVHFRKGDLREARRYFERARQLAPTYPYLWMNLSALALAENRIDDAVAAAQQAVRFGGNLAPSHFHYGAALQRQGKLAEAIAEYRRATEIDPKDAQSRAALSRAAGVQAAADSEKVEAAMMAEGLRLLDIERDADKAAEQFRALLQRHPNHYGATWQLARALDAAGRTGEARTQWEAALVLAREGKDTAGEAKIRQRLAVPAR